MIKYIIQKDRFVQEFRTFKICNSHSGNRTCVLYEEEGQGKNVKLKSGLHIFFVFRKIEDYELDLVWSKITKNCRVY